MYKFLNFEGKTGRVEIKYSNFFFQNDDILDVLFENVI